MKRIKKLLAAAQVFTVVFSVGESRALADASDGWGARPSSAPSSGPGGSMTQNLGTNDTNTCDAICSDYYKHVGGGTDEVAQACGSPNASPTPNSTDGLVVHNTARANGGFSSYDECKSSIVAEWNQLASYCDAIKVIDGATQYDQTSAGIYTGVAAVCLTGCVLEKTPAVAVGIVNGFQIGCTVGSLGAAATDIGMDIGLAVKTSNLDSMEKDGDGTGNRAGEAVAGILGAGGAVVQTVSTVSETAMDKMKNNDMCISGALVAAAAAIKWGMQAKYSSNKAEICKNIVKLPGFGNAVIAHDDPQKFGGAPGRFNSSAGNLTAGAGSGIKGRTPGQLAGDQPSFDGGPSSTISAALGDGGNRMLNRFPNKDKFPELLAKTGLSFSGIGSQLAAGSSPSDIFGDVSTLQSLVPGMKDLEKMALNGQLSMEGSYTSGGGAGAKAPAKEGGGLFGNLTKKLGLSAATDDKQFGSTRKPQAVAEDGDIFHEHFQGSIFQIVSQKLDKTHDRIEMLEWQTPLNRALNGLSNQGRVPNTGGR